MAGEFKIRTTGSVTHRSAIHLWPRLLRLPLTLRKNRKNCKNILFGLLIQFESSDLARSGLKRFLLLQGNTEQHSHRWKNSEIGPKRAKNVLNLKNLKIKNLKILNFQPLKIFQFFLVRVHWFVKFIFFWFWTRTWKVQGSYKIASVSQCLSVCLSVSQQLFSELAH